MSDASEYDAFKRENLLLNRRELNDNKYSYWAINLSDDDLYLFLAAAGEFGSRVTPDTAARLALAQASPSVYPCDVSAARAAAGLQAVSDFVRGGRKSFRSFFRLTHPWPPAELLATVAGWKDTYFAEVTVGVGERLRHTTDLPTAAVTSASPRERQNVPPAAEGRFIFVSRRRLEGNANTRWATNLTTDHLWDFVCAVGEFHKVVAEVCARLLMAQCQNPPDMNIARAAAGLRLLGRRGTFETFDESLAAVLRFPSPSTEIKAMSASWLHSGE